MKKFKFFFLIFFLILCTSIYCSESLTVHFIDVGEGDSVLIQLPDNKNILVDCGNLSAGYVVEKYLKAKNISRLERIVVTHMHPDHVGGIFSI